MKSIFVLTLLAAVSLLPVAPGYAAEQDATPAANAVHAARSAEANRSAEDEDDLVVTQHTITVQGKSLAYTATAGTIPITDDAGKLQAKMFFVAYVGSDGGHSRPVTFAFNGGPGASSMWLHLGIGPKRVMLPADGTMLPKSTVLTDNESTWLRFTDLVFVDPVGTGYSRAAPGIDERQFYEVVRDIDAAAAFVRRYVSRYQRWLSPKFIAGESYGTTRAAALVNRLQNVAGINLNGVMLVSSVLDFHTIAFEAPNDLPYVLALPSYAATIWYHDKAPGSVTSVVREAEQWAMSDYLVALAKGDSIGDAEKSRIADRLARYTGLDKAELERRRLRVGPLTFGRQVLRQSGRRVGRFDSRVTAPAESPSTESSDSDPSFFLVTGPLVEALNAYLRGELQYRSDLRYEYFSRDANRAWKWRSGGQGYLYVGDELAEAMSRDPRLKVFAAAGYYDLATPYLAQKYTFEHMELDRPLRANLTFVGYASGHQIYTDPASAAKLESDVERFVTCSVEHLCEQE
ncbi:MAG TPA: peptidase S10 [Burkholderiales bacterium]|nr:peptidase S10 [Burkholderiales bacterium]